MHASLAFPLFILVRNLLFHLGGERENFHQEEANICSSSSSIGPIWSLFLKGGEGGIPKSL